MIELSQFDFQLNFEMQKSKCSARSHTYSIFDLDAKKFFVQIIGTSRGNKEVRYLVRSCEEQSSTLLPLAKGDAMLLDPLSSPLPPIASPPFEGVKESIPMTTIPITYVNQVQTTIQTTILSKTAFPYFQILHKTMY